MKTRNLRRVVEDFAAERIDRSIQVLNDTRYSSDICNYMRCLSGEELASCCRMLNNVVSNLEEYETLISALDD